MPGSPATGRAFSAPPTACAPESDGMVNRANSASVDVARHTVIAELLERVVLRSTLSQLADKRAAKALREPEGGPEPSRTAGRHAAHSTFQIPNSTLCNP